MGFRKGHSPQALPFCLIVTERYEVCAGGRCGYSTFYRAYIIRVINATISAWVTKEGLSAAALRKDGHNWCYVIHRQSLCLTPSSVRGTEAVIQHHYSKCITFKLLFGHEQDTL